MTCRGSPNWPPDWKGTYGPDNPLPCGEVGNFIGVEAASDILEIPRCFVVMQWNQQEYVGCLYFDDEGFLRQIVDLLGSCTGRSIAEIGSLDIP